MGARFRLKSTYDISHFSAQAQVILLAMQHYGLILADNGSNWFFSGTEDASWPNSLLSELKTIPASQFEAVDESSLIIDPNSAAVRSCGGGVADRMGPGGSPHAGILLSPAWCSVPWLWQKSARLTAVRTATLRSPRRIPR